MVLIPGVAEDEIDVVSDLMREFLKSAVPTPVIVSLARPT